MPVYRFQGPDGKVHRAEASSPEEAQRGLEAMWASNAKAPGPKSAWGLPVVGDFVDSWNESRSAMGAEAKANTDRARRVTSGQGLSAADQLSQFLSTPRQVMNAVGALSAPFAGITRPVSRAVANLPLQAYRPGTFDKLSNAEEAKQVEGQLNTASMAVAPARSRFAPKLEVRPPPRPAAVPKAEASAAGYVGKLTRDAPLVARTRPQTAAEAAGKPAEVALGALARRPGTTADALGGMVSERQLTRPTRMLEDVANAAGVAPEAAAGDIKALVDVGRKNAAPLYEQAYAAGPISTPELQALSARPSLREGLRRAADIAAEEGRNPGEIGLNVKGDGVELHQPTAQTWDYVKRGVDDVLEGYRDKTTGKLVLDEKGRAIVGTLKQMRHELINANPVYGKALETAGDYMSADAAFKDGGKLLFNGNFTEKQFADKLAAMSPTELDAFRGGIANKFYDLGQTGKLDPKVLKTPRVRAKLEAALGPDGAQRLIQAADEEAAMLAFERRRAPDANSITQEMKAAMAEQDGVAGPGEAMAQSVIDRGLRGSIVKGLAKGASGVMARARTGGLTEEARNEAGRLLMMPPEELAAYLKAFEAKRPARALRPLPKVGALTAGLPPPAPRPARR